MNFNSNNKFNGRKLQFHNVFGENNIVFAKCFVCYNSIKCNLQNWDRMFLLHFILLYHLGEGNRLKRHKIFFSFFQLFSFHFSSNVFHKRCLMSELGGGVGFLEQEFPIIVCYAPSCVP
jgi:hypothetical protein